MNTKKVDEIMQKIIIGWKKKIPEGAQLDPKFLNRTRDFLKICPDEDGKKRIRYAPTGNTHIVPYEDLILNGIKDLEKYPIEERGQNGD